MCFAWLDIKMPLPRRTDAGRSGWQKVAAASVEPDRQGQESPPPVAKGTLLSASDLRQMDQSRVAWLANPSSSSVNSVLLLLLGLFPVLLLVVWLFCFEKIGITSIFSGAAKKQAQTDFRGNAKKASTEANAYDKNGRGGGDNDDDDDNDDDNDDDDNDRNDDDDDDCNADSDFECQDDACTVDGNRG